MAADSEVDGINARKASPNSRGGGAQEAIDQFGDRSRTSALEGNQHIISWVDGVESGDIL